MVTNDQVRQATEYLNSLIYNQWITEHFLSPTWFGQVLFVLLSYFIFFYLVDRKRVTQILLFGSLVAISFAVYDSIGEKLGQWEYLKYVLPFSPNFFLGDLTIIPLYAMLVYQYTFSWRAFVQWSIVWAGLLVFAYYDFILASLDVFHYLTPTARYMDFTLFLLVSIIARALVIDLLKMQVKQETRASSASSVKFIANPAMKYQENDDDERS